LSLLAVSWQPKKRMHLFARKTGHHPPAPPSHLPVLPGTSVPPTPAADSQRPHATHPQITVRRADRTAGVVSVVVLKVG